MLAHRWVRLVGVIEDHWRGRRLSSAAPPRSTNPNPINTHRTTFPDPVSARFAVGLDDEGAAAGAVTWTLASGSAGTLPAGYRLSDDGGMSSIDSDWLGETSTSGVPVSCGTEFSLVFV